MNYKKIADTALLAGRIMLESNAETYRVEETMQYILKTSQLQHTEAYALATGLMVSLDDSSIDAITLIQRVPNRSTDLSKIHKVNTVSRALTSQQITIDQAHAQLTSIDALEYSQRHIDIATIFLAISFTIMLGGQIYDGLITFLNAILLVGIWRVARLLKASSFLANTIGASIAAAIASLLLRLFPDYLSLEAIIVGSIMPMVPGTIITNAIRDTFRGDHSAGIARALEAFMIALSIALGVAIGLLILGGSYLP